jgi:hypothetical protein
MSIESILQQLDGEINTLKQARATLNGLNSSTPTVPGKRVVSAKARRRMAKAQRIRWAKVRTKKRASK